MPPRTTARLFVTVMLSIWGSQASAALATTAASSPVGERGLVYKGRTVFAVGSGSFWLLGDPYYYRDDGSTDLTRLRRQLDAYRPANVDGKGLGVIRLGAWCTPLRYSGLDPGKIRYPCRRDGDRFDCSKLDPHYFDHLLTVAREAAARGILLGIVLWDEIPLERRPTRWQRHPFCKSNSRTDYGLPACGQDAVPEFYDPGNRKLLAVQEAIVDRFVATLAAEENVFFFVGNEYTGGARWRDRQIRAIDESCARHGCDLLHVTMDWSGGPSKLSDAVSLHTRDGGSATGCYRKDGRPAINQRDSSADGGQRSARRQRGWTRFFLGAASAGTRDDYNGDTPPWTIFYSAAAEDQALRGFVDAIAADLAELSPDSATFIDPGWIGRSRRGSEYVGYSRSSGGSVTIDLTGQGGSWELFEWKVEESAAAPRSAGRQCGGGRRSWTLESKGESAVRVTRVTTVKQCE